MFECCYKDRIKDAFTNRNPTINDTQIDAYSLVVNESTGDLFFKTKDGDGNPKITKLSGGGAGSDGIKTINGVSSDSSGEFNLEFDSQKFNVEKTANGLKVSLKSSGSGINSISLNGKTIAPDTTGNVDLQTENGIEGTVE